MGCERVDVALVVVVRGCDDGDEGLWVVVVVVTNYGVSSGDRLWR